MIEQVFGLARSRATTKPRQQHPDPVFYRCSQCEHIVQLTALLDPGQTTAPSCCSMLMEQLTPLPTEALPEGITLDYKIVGGYNNNAVQLHWNCSAPFLRPSWVYLKNYTGGQLRYIDEKKKSPVSFALADEDAYVYCDQSPCLECIFRCKSAFLSLFGSTLSA